MCFKNLFELFVLVCTPFFCFGNISGVYGQRTVRKIRGKKSIDYIPIHINQNREPENFKTLQKLREINFPSQVVHKDTNVPEDHLPRPKATELSYSQNSDPWLLALMSPFFPNNAVQSLLKIRKLVKWKYVWSTNMEWELILTVYLITVSCFFSPWPSWVLRLKFSLCLMQFLIFCFLSRFFSFILKMLEGRVANTAYICLGSLLSFGIREADNTCAFRQTFGG